MALVEDDSSGQGFRNRPAHCNGPFKSLTEYTSKLELLHGISHSDFASSIAFLNAVARFFVLPFVRCFPVRARRASSVGSLDDVE